MHKYEAVDLEWVTQIIRQYPDLVVEEIAQKMHRSIGCVREILMALVRQDILLYQVVNKGEAQRLSYSLH